MNEKDPIERELRNALSVDPSPGFQDRVRAHAYRQPKGLAWNFRWAFAAATASAKNAPRRAVERRRNTIMAGPFFTDISKAWDMDAFERMAQQSIPLGRGGKPEEIVGAILYMVSGLSSYVTGALLDVSGGR